VREQLAQSRYVKRNGRDKNLRPLDCKSDVLYSSWWGFTTASERQRLEASLCRAQRSALCPSHKPTLTQLAEDADNTLFRTIITPNIMFYTASYLSLSELTTHTILDLGLIILNLALNTIIHDDRNFIHRMLFANYSDISYSL